MSCEPTEFVRHMLVKVDYLLEQSRRATREQFLIDETLKRAFARSIEILGEAAKQVPDEFRNAHSDIPWKGMAGMRDRLIHGYFGVDYELVWDVAISKIPELQIALVALLGEAKE